MKSPQLPLDAPYNENQRAWLSGFFAGMQTHLVQSAGIVTQTDSRLITILYGSQTGTAESVANDAAAVAKTYGLKPLVKSMDEIEADALSSIDYLLIITSTYGEGEMPDNAQMLWDGICAETMPRLEGMQYSVLALGDTSYDLFCQAGIDWDNKLVELGATRVYERTDCDVDFEEPAERWMTAVIPYLAGGVTTIIVETDTSATGKPEYHRKNPFPAKLLVNRLLTDASSSKETRHYEISIAGSGLTYEAFLP
jgi:sulfite reductase (NADPH) flavoprotein alpha-component